MCVHARVCVCVCVCKVMYYVVHHFFILSVNRPIAGSINLCPDAVQGSDMEKVITTVKHELLHALVCIVSLNAVAKECLHDYRDFLVPCMHSFMMKTRCLAQIGTVLLVYH